MNDSPSPSALTGEPTEAPLALPPAHEPQDLTSAALTEVPIAPESEGGGAVLGVEAALADTPLEKPDEAFAPVETLIEEPSTGELVHDAEGDAKPQSQAPVAIEAGEIAAPVVAEAAAPAIVEVSPPTSATVPEEISPEPEPPARLPELGEPVSEAPVPETVPVAPLAPAAPAPAAPIVTAEVLPAAPQADAAAAEAAPSMSAIGVLLVNLGTPEAAEAPAVRRYLKEFLTDKRVIEKDTLLWKMALNGIILPLRSRRKARDYRKIWNEAQNESPLKTITRSQAEKLAGILEPLGRHIVVDWAMRYGNPSIASRLEALIARGCGRIGGLGRAEIDQKHADRRHGWRCLGRHRSFRGRRRQVCFDSARKGGGRYRGRGSERYGLGRGGFGHRNRRFRLRGRRLGLR